LQPLQNRRFDPNTFQLPRKTKVQKAIVAPERRTVVSEAAGTRQPPPYVRALFEKQEPCKDVAARPAAAAAAVPEGTATVATEGPATAATEGPATAAVCKPEAIASSDSEPDEITGIAKLLNRNSEQSAALYISKKHKAMWSEGKVMVQVEGGAECSIDHLITTLDTPISPDAKFTRGFEGSAARYDESKKPEASDAEPMEVSALLDNECKVEAEQMVVTGDMSPPSKPQVQQPPHGVDAIVPIAVKREVTDDLSRPPPPEPMVQRPPHGADAILPIAVQPASILPAEGPDTESARFAVRVFAGDLWGAPLLRKVIYSFKRYLHEA
jgi:hypothetical protein